MAENANLSKAQRLLQTMVSFGVQPDRKSLVSLAQMYKQNPELYDKVFNALDFMGANYGNKIFQFTPEQMTTAINQYKLYDYRTQIGYEPIEIPDLSFDPSQYVDEAGQYDDTLIEALGQWYKHNKALPQPYQQREFENFYLLYKQEREEQDLKDQYYLAGYDKAGEEPFIWNTGWQAYGFDYDYNDPDDIRRMQLKMPPKAFLDLYKVHTEGESQQEAYEADEDEIRLMTGKLPLALDEEYQKRKQKEAMVNALYAQGMDVQRAIQTTEEFFRSIEEGLTPEEAALRIDQKERLQEAKRQVQTELTEMGLDAQVAAGYADEFEQLINEGTDPEIAIKQVYSNVPQYVAAQEILAKQKEMRDLLAGVKGDYDENKEELYSRYTQFLYNKVVEYLQKSEVGQGILERVNARGLDVLYDVNPNKLGEKGLNKDYAWTAIHKQHFNEKSSKQRLFDWAKLIGLDANYFPQSDKMMRILHAEANGPSTDVDAAIIEAGAKSPDNKMVKNKYFEAREYTGKVPMDAAYVMLTPQEKDTVNYYYGMGDDETAEMVLDIYLRRHAVEFSQREEFKHLKELAVKPGDSGWTKAWKKIRGTLESLGSIIPNIGVAGQTIWEGIFNPDMPLTETTMTMAARRGRAGQQSVTYGWEPGVGKFFAEAGTSMVQNLPAIFTGPAAGPIIMASSAGGQASLNVKDLGGTAGQSLRQAIAFGAAEYIGEKIALDKLFKWLKTGQKGIKNTIKAAMKQAGIEAGEEAVTEVVQVLTDWANMKEKSQIVQYLDEYMRNNPDATKTDAVLGTALRVFGDVAYAAGQGAVSGFGFGAGAHTIGAYTSSQEPAGAQPQAAAVTPLTGGAAETQPQATQQEEPNFIKLPKSERMEVNTYLRGKGLKNPYIVIDRQDGAITGYREFEDLTEAGQNAKDTGGTLYKVTESQTGNKQYEKLAEPTTEAAIEKPSKLPPKKEQLTADTLLKYAEEAERNATIETNPDIARGFKIRAENLRKQAEALQAKEAKAAKKKAPAPQKKTTGPVVDYHTADTLKTLDARTRSYVGLVDKFAKLIGRKVTWARSIKDSYGNKANGFYDRKTGNLVLSTQATRVGGKSAYSYVAAHEMTHALESSGKYKELHDTVLGYFSEAELAKERKRVGNLWNTEDADAIDREIVADWVSKNLFQDQRAIRRFVNEHRGVVGAILNWFDSILAKIGNKDIQLRNEFRKARKLWQEAFDEVAQQEGPFPFGKTGIEYSIQGNNISSEVQNNGRGKGLIQNNEAFRETNRVPEGNVRPQNADMETAPAGNQSGNEGRGVYGRGNSRGGEVFSVDSIQGNNIDSEVQNGRQGETAGIEGITSGSISAGSVRPEGTFGGANTLGNQGGAQSRRQIEQGNRRVGESFLVKPHDDPASFAAAIHQAILDNPYGAFVHEYTAEEYADMQLFMSEDGYAGIAVKPDGDIVSVFKNPKSTQKNVAHELLLTALRNGGQKLDCFDGYLTTLYSKHGFRPVARVAFDREYAPEGWNYERDGEPDILFFIHDGEAIISDIEKGLFKTVKYQIEKLPLYASYDNAMAYRDELLQKQNRTEKPKIPISPEGQAVMDRLENDEEVPTKEIAYSMNGEPFDSARQQYGELPNRPMVRARSETLPARFGPNEYTRSTYQTAYESANLSDLQADEAALQASMDTYARIQDVAAERRADNLIANIGYVNALRQWQAVVAGTQPATKDMIVLAEKLMLDAFERGDSQTGIELLSQIAIEGTRAGQVSQAIHMIKTLSKSGQAIHLQRIVDKYNVEMAKKGKPPIALDRQLVLEYYNAPTFEEAEKVKDKIIADLASQMPATLAEKLTAYRYMSMLLNLRTHGRNIVSNGAMFMMKALKDTIGTGLEKMLIPDKSQRTKAWINLLSENDRALLSFAAKDARAVEDILRSGGKEGNLESQIQEYRKIYNTQWLEKVRRFSNDSLEAEDWWFLMPNYSVSLAQVMKARGLTEADVTGTSPEAIKALAEAREIAIKEAKEATFRDMNALANWISKLEKHNAFTRLVVGGLLPFKRTPLNIIERGLEYSPLGLLKSLSYDLIRVARGNMSTVDALNNISKGLAGSTVFGLGMVLCSLGIIVGKQDKDREGYYLKDVGEQPYSIRIGDAYYTIDWISPQNMPLFMGVEFMNQLMSGPDASIPGAASRFFDSMASVSDPVFQLSMLQGINKALKSYGEEGIGGSLGTMVIETTKSYLQQYIPTLAGQLARTIDPTRRSTYTPKDAPLPAQAGKFVKQVGTKLPWVSRSEEPYINKWGQEQTDPDSVFWRTVKNFISPGYLTYDTETAVDYEIQRVYNSTQESTVIPASTTGTRTLNDEPYYLNEKEMTTYQKTQGQLSYDVLEDLFALTEYKKLNAETQAMAIANVYSYARDVADQEFFTGRHIEREISTTNKAVEAGKAVGLKAAEVILFRTLAGELSADKDAKGNTISGSKKKKVVDLLQTMGFNAEQQTMLLEISGYTTEATSNVSRIPMRSKTPKTPERTTKKSLPTRRR